MQKRSVHSKKDPNSNRVEYSTRHHLQNTYLPIFDIFCVRRVCVYVYVCVRTAYYGVCLQTLAKPNYYRQFRTNLVLPLKFSTRLKLASSLPTFSKVSKFWFDNAILDNHCLSFTMKEWFKRKKLLRRPPLKSIFGRAKFTAEALERILWPQNLCKICKIF